MTKTRVRVETIVQPLYKVYLSTPAKSGWYCLNANSETHAIQLTKQAYPTYKVSNCVECLENQTICWN